MERTVEVIHVSLKVKVGFESFTHVFEQLLGRFDPSSLGRLETDPRFVEQQLRRSEGEEGLMLFNIQEHGKLLNIVGEPKKAKQYVLGNPLIAATMTRHDIRAALYAPLRLLAYEEADGSTVLEYDQPSSLFGQFNHPEVTAVARSLDTKLANLIHKTESSAARANDTIP